MRNLVSAIVIMYIERLKRSKIEHGRGGEAGEVDLELNVRKRAKSLSFRDSAHINSFIIQRG